MTGNPINDFFIAIGTGIASELLNAGMKKFRDIVQGDAEARAWRRVFEEGFANTLNEVSEGLDKIQLDHLAILLKEYVRQPAVANNLIAVVIHRTTLPMQILREEFEQNFDTESLEFGETKIVFDDFVRILGDELDKATHKIASEPNSPLYNAISLPKQQRMEDNIEQILSKVTSLTETSEQIEKLQEIVSEEVSRWLENIERDWNTGKYQNVLSDLESFRQDNNKWQAVEQPVKAKLLRMEGTFRLDVENGVDKAKTLFEEARNLDPSSDEERYIQARLAFIDKKYTEAYNLLEDLTGDNVVLLRTVVLIETQQYEDAKKQLEKLDKTSNIHAWYNNARIHLLQGRIELAIEAIESALKIAPLSIELRFLLAQLFYQFVLAPAVQFKNFQNLPEVRPYTLYRLMPGYLSYLERARDIFRELSEFESGEIRQLAQIWYLACLLNLPSDNKQEITTYCQELIDNSSHAELCVAWALDWKVDVNYDVYIQRTEKVVKSSTALPKHVIALSSYLLEENKPHEALDLLRSNREIFSEVNDLWLYWMCKIHIDLRDFDKASKYVQKIADEGMKHELLLSLFDQNDDEEGIRNLLQKSLHPVLTMFACYSLSRQGDRSWVKDYAEMIIRQINTEFSFNLVTEAAYQNQETNLCIRLLDTISDSYPSDKLPLRFWELRIQCLVEQGKLRQAYLDARRLYAHHPSPISFVALFAVYHHIGDIEQISIISRDLLDKIDLPPVNTLIAAKLVSLTNRQLSIDLWRKAMKQTLPDESVVLALMLAQSLGLKSETESLHVRLQQLAEQEGSGVWHKTGPELVDFINDQREHDTSLDELYKKGEIPFHDIVAQTHIPFAAPYHYWLDKIEEYDNLETSFALMARHGNRLMLTGKKLEDLKGRLALDITSILFCTHFGFLELVEDNVAPIYLPHQLLVILTQTLLHYHEQDLQRIEACKKIVQFVEQYPESVVALEPLVEADQSLVNEVGQKWLQLFQLARDSQGLYVNFLPVRKRGLTLELAKLPEDAEQYLINARSIVDALLNNQVITKSEHRRIIYALGDSGIEKTTTIPQKGKKVFFYANTLEQLAGHDLLGKMKHLLEIQIVDEQIHEAKTVVKGDTESQKIKEWLLSLIDRLHQGVLQDKYRLLPLSSTVADQFDVIGPYNYSWVALFEQCQSEEYAIVIDDSFANKFTLNNEAQVLTSVDILNVLAEEKIIAIEDYYHLMARIRRSNIRYIPYSAGEILFHLKKALNSETLSIEETFNIVTMCRYLDSCVTQINQSQSHLKEEERNKNGELGFLEISFTQILDSILRIWSSNLSSPLCSLFSEWILDNLYVPHREILIKQKVLLPPDNVEQPYEEIFRLSRRLSPIRYRGGFSMEEKFRIWLWYWIERNGGDYSFPIKVLES